MTCDTWCGVNILSNKAKAISAELLKLNLKNKMEELKNTGHLLLDRVRKK